MTAFFLAMEAAPPAKADTFRPLPGIKPTPVHATTGCRWPVHASGDPLKESATHFCGARKGPKLSYCAVHQRVAIGLGTPSERAAVREAGRVA